MVRQLIFKCIHALVDLAFRYCISVGKFILQYIGKMYEMNFAIMETPGGNTYMCQCVVCIYLLTVILIVVAVVVVVVAAAAAAATTTTVVVVVVAAAAAAAAAAVVAVEGGGEGVREGEGVGEGATTAVVGALILCVHPVVKPSMPV